MILVRSPLRVTFGGGGTDFPSFYREHGGYLVSAAIDKYVYVAITNPVTKGLFLKYKTIEEAPTPDGLSHELVREALKMLKIDRLALTTFADIPAGTGLGSSGAFTTALLKALYLYKGVPLPTHRLAGLACELEIDRLHHICGKQDQYISAYGGICGIRFDGKLLGDVIRMKPLNLSPSTLTNLESNLLLFYTGIMRDSEEVQSKLAKPTSPTIENLKSIRTLGYAAHSVLDAGNMDKFAHLLTAQWEMKKDRDPQTTTPSIDFWFSQALSHGAIGGKLVGAGGGGFLMFYADDPEQLRAEMALFDLPEVRFKFDFEGTKVVSP